MLLHLLIQSQTGCALPGAFANARERCTSRGVLCPWLETLVSADARGWVRGLTANAGNEGQG